jgi:hypothetical protein
MIERGLLSENDFAESITNDRINGKRSNFFVRDLLNILVAFPTPMEEPTNDLPCTYLGCVYVEKPGGMDVLRPAIERVAKTVPEEKWLKVFVNISPSSFTISSDNVHFLKIKFYVFMVFIGSKRTITRLSYSIFIISWCWTRSKVNFQFSVLLKSDFLF